MAAPPLTREQQDLAAQWAGLPAFAARKLRVQPSSPLWDELVSAGHEALCKATRTWDPAFGVKFKTYAVRACYRLALKTMRRLTARAARETPLSPGDALDRRHPGGDVPEALEPFGALTPFVDGLGGGMGEALAEEALGGGDVGRRCVKAVAGLRMELVGGLPEGARGAGDKWTAEEETYLRREAEAGRLRGPEGVEAAAAALGRTVKGVRRKLARLERQGTLPPPPPTPTEELAGLRKRAALLGWEVSESGGFFGETLWVHAATRRTAGEAEVLALVERAERRAHGGGRKG